MMEMLEGLVYTMELHYSVYIYICIYIYAYMKYMSLESLGIPMESLEHRYVDIQGSFADMYPSHECDIWIQRDNLQQHLQQGSFVDIQGSFVDIQGSFAGYTGLFLRIVIHLMCVIDGYRGNHLQQHLQQTSNTPDSIILVGTRRGKKKKREKAAAFKCLEAGFVVIRYS